MRARGDAHRCSTTPLLLDVSAGPDLGAPYYAPAPGSGPFAEEVGADPGKLKIAVSWDPITPAEVHPDCRRAAEETASLCESLGHHVEEAKPDADGEHFSRFFTTVWLGMLGWMIRDWSRKNRPDPRVPSTSKPIPGRCSKVDSRTRPSDFLLAVHDMQLFAREVAPFFERYDVWLTPTMTQPPVPLGYFDFDAARAAAKRREGWRTSRASAPSPT